MKTSTQTAVALVAAWMLGSLPAHATLVNVETVTVSQYATVINAEAYTWSFSASGWFIGNGAGADCPACTTNGTVSLLAAGDRKGSTVRVTMTDLGSAAFDLASFGSAVRARPRSIPSTSSAPWLLAAP